VKTTINLLNNKYTQMKIIGKFGLAALAAGAFCGVSLTGSAQTPDIFTKHDLPIPGAYFAHRESQKPAIVAVSKSGQGVRENMQTTPKIEKRRAQSVHFTKEGLSR
jgi:hypothetical protein